MGISNRGVNLTHLSRCKLTHPISRYELRKHTGYRGVNLTHLTVSKDTNSVTVVTDLSYPSGLAAVRLAVPGRQAGSITSFKSTSRYAARIEISFDSNSAAIIAPLRASFGGTPKER